MNSLLTPTCRLLRLLPLTMLALSCGLCSLARADVYIINANLWLGTKDSNWFDPDNWYLGDKYPAPLPQLNVWVSPIRDVSEGVPPNTFIGVPVREAVLNQAFSAKGFGLIGWDGLSQVRIVAGGLLHATSDIPAQVGNDNLVSVYGGAQQKANLILDGGNISGDWNFYSNSRVEVRGSYTQKQGDWSGVVGELAITAGSRFNGSSLSHTTVNRIVNEGTLDVAASQALRLSGEVLNKGIIAAPVTGSAFVWITGDTTLAGTGTTFLSTPMIVDGGTTYLMGGPGTLTIGAGQTVHAKSSIGGGNGINLVNMGTLTVDASGLRFYAKEGGVLENSSGLIKVSDNAFVDVLQLHSVWGQMRGGIRGGTISGAGSSLLRSDTENVRFTGNLMFNGSIKGQSSIAQDAVLTIGRGNGITTAGVIDNHGQLIVGSLADRSSGLMDPASIHLDGDTRLSGSGTTTLLNDFTNVSLGTFALTVASGHTLRGGGFVYGFGQALTNQGRISVEGDGITGPTSVLKMYLQNGSVLNNQGRIDIAVGSTLEMAGQTLNQTADQAVTHVNGNLTVGTLNLKAGILSGSGTIDGAVIVGSGTVSPGNSPGKLTINGSLLLGADSTLEIQIFGGTSGLVYDLMQVNGHVSLNGRLRVDFGNYSPQIGDSFAFLSGASISGEFTSVETPNYVLNTYFDGQMLRVRVQDVSAVPEATTWMQLLSGLSMLAAVYAHRGSRVRSLRQATL